MPPRTRRNEGARKEVDVEMPSAGEVDIESSFSQLAHTHWLKPSKKSTKVKVKQDVLKNDIWDVLEKGDFAFGSLLVLENLQILERYDPSRILFSKTTKLWKQLFMAGVLRRFFQLPCTAYSIDSQCEDARTSANMGYVMLLGYVWTILTEL